MVTKSAVQIMCFGRPSPREKVKSSKLTRRNTKKKQYEGYSEPLEFVVSMLRLYRVPSL